MNYKEEFIKVLGEPNSEKYLDKYLNLCVDKNNDFLDGEYVEKHHILPKCTHEKYSNLKYFESNKSTLKYEYHKLAHKFLSKAYNIKPYVIATNLMYDTENARQELFKYAAECLWEKYINDKEYREDISRRRSQTLKYSWTNDMREQKSIFMKNCWEDPEYREKITKKVYDWYESEEGEIFKKEASLRIKEQWKDPDFREKSIQNMVLEKSTPEAKIRMSNSSKKVWKSKSTEELQTFKEKMKVINSDENKREDASIKIKSKWKNVEFKEKMKNRKPRGSNGENIKTKWEDPEYRENQRIGRLASRIKKKLPNDKLKECENLNKKEIVEKYKCYLKKDIK